MLKHSYHHIHSVRDLVANLIETVIPKIKEDGGIKFNYILPQKGMVPKKRAELLKNASFHEFIKKIIEERSMVDRIQVAILLNEKQATVMFPTAKGLGGPDMNSVFYSEDPLFHERCLDYFRSNWYNSKSTSNCSEVNVKVHSFTVTMGQGNVPLVLRRFNSVFEPEIPVQTAAESACLAKPI